MATYDYSKFTNLATRRLTKYGNLISIEKKNNPDSTWKQLVYPDGTLYWYNTLTEATSSTKPSTVTTNFSTLAVLDEWDFTDKENNGLIQEGDRKLITRSDTVTIEIGDKITTPDGGTFLAYPPIRTIDPPMSGTIIIQEVNVRGN